MKDLKENDFLLAIIYFCINISLNSIRETAIMTALYILFSLFLIISTIKAGKAKKLGLCQPEGNLKQYLYFIPLMVPPIYNLLSIFSPHFSLSGTISGTSLSTFSCSTENLSLHHINTTPSIEFAFFLIRMICAGFVEEFIFRGLLFPALCHKSHDNVTFGVVISSTAFSLAHLLNLFGGSPLLPTILQVCYSFCIGFMFAAVFFRCRSLVPCIVSHCAINLFSAFSINNLSGTLKAPESLALQIAILLTVSVLSFLYGIFLLKTESRRDH